MWLDRKIAGYALFVSRSSSDADDPPLLSGVFDTLAEARAELEKEGAVAPSK